MSNKVAVSIIFVWVLFMTAVFGCVSNPYPRKDLAPDQIQAIDNALVKLPRK